MKNAIPSRKNNEQQESRSTGAEPYLTYRSSRAPERRTDNILATGSIRCAIYVRISDEDGIKKELTSLESQEIYCREFVAAQPNWEVVEVYCDDGYTGGNMNRPALKRLLDDVRQERMD
jgi:hypothetical protein